MNPLRRWFRGARPARPARRNRVRPQVEGLESRVVLYSASGNMWPNPQLITISFMPDGTSIGGGYSSNFFSAFSKVGSAAKLESVVLQAAQAWAQQTNINFAVVPDDGAPQGSGADMQGDPEFGDIRIGGFDFGSSTLALTYQPPQVNNYSVAGDVAFNTGQAFHIGTTYDMYTVAMHEIGHALGLNESGVAGSVMYGTYTGTKRALASDDISGIRSIYSSGSPRTPDAYNVNGNSNASLNMSTWINGDINYSNLTAMVPDLDITSAGQSEYFAFTPPYGSTTLNLDVQSSGLSLLAPRVTVYDSTGKTVLASGTATGQYGTDLMVTVPNLVVGQNYYVKVQGADTTQMGTGRYALGLNFTGGATPTEASPNTAVPNGNPLHSGGGQADNGGDAGYTSVNPAIVGIAPDNGVSSQDGITNNPRISISGTAPAFETVTVYRDGQAIGQTVAGVDNTWTFDDTATALPDGVSSFTATATDSAGYTTAPSAAFDVVVDTHVPQPPSLVGISPDTGPSATDGITSANRPTFTGTTEPFAIVNLFSNGSQVPFGTTEADISGNWSYTVGQPGNLTDHAPGAMLTPPGAVGALINEVSGLLGALGLGSLVGGLTQSGGPGQPLPDGTYHITATAMDVAGTVSAASAPMTVVIDTRTPPPPKVTGISPDTGSSSTDGVTTSHNLTITGTSQAGTLVTVLINNAPVGVATTGSAGTWTFDDTATTLPDGRYAIRAVAMDLAGNLSGVSGPFNATVETVAPPAIAAAGVISGTQGLHPNHQGLSLIGTAPANARITVSLGGSLLGAATADGQGNWTYVYALGSRAVPAGTYGFSAVAMDNSGDVSAPSAFTLDVGGGPTAGTPQYASGVLSGQATPGSLVSIVDGDVIIGVVTADASGNWQFTPALSRGKHTIMVGAADGSGNTSLLSGSITVTA